MRETVNVRTYITNYTINENLEHYLGSAAGVVNGAREENASVSVDNQRSPIVGDLPSLHFATKHHH